MIADNYNRFILCGGLYYIPFDESGMWKIQIVKEMKAVGLDVDANKIC